MNYRNVCYLKLLVGIVLSKLGKSNSEVSPLPKTAHKMLIIQIWHPVRFAAKSSYKKSGRQYSGRFSFHFEKIKFDHFLSNFLISIDRTRPVERDILEKNEKLHKN